MVTGDSLSGDQVSIFIGEVDDIGTAFNATNDPSGDLQFQAEVTSFDVSGGEEEVESIVVFGGGNIDRNKPRAQLEISMDVILRYGTNVDQWDLLLSAGVKKMIAIQSTDGSNYYWNAWNNAKVINFDKEFAAEDEWRGTMTFKLSPTDAEAVANTQVGKADILTDLTAWS
jgi:hypothetical protein